MNKELALKALFIFGGGLMLFAIARPKHPDSTTTAATTDAGTKSFDSTPVPTKENAEIAKSAYLAALEAGETPSTLTELNKELMSDFGVRCYQANGDVVVCDVSGNKL
jgi:L-alanine-DL-glutamate epimerase-like enolase superfamily enzyme